MECAIAILIHLSVKAAPLIMYGIVWKVIDEMFD